MKKILLAALVFGVLVSCSQREVSQKPNILFLFTDDQTYNSIRALGNSEIYTPNLDRLVRQGTSFTNAYNMGGWNGAICTASRSMLISGRSLWRVNNFRQHWQKGDSLAQTWGQLMEANGYDTYMTGKWHVDASAGKVFGQAEHIRPGMPKDAWDHFKMVDLFANEVANGEVTPEEIMPVGYNRPLDENDTSWSPTDPKFGGFWAGGKHWSEVVRDDALSFLDSAQQRENPFFMYIAFNAPHDPRQAPQEYQDMYDLADISLPESWMPEYPYQHLIGNGPSLRDEALAPFPRTEYATKVHIKEYYAIISHLDEQIGQILDALEASGKLENTYIFFTSDHGLAMGRHGLIGKQSQFEHSVKPPLIIAGPGIPANQQLEMPVYLQDLMPTALELAGIKKPGYVEFNSLVPLATRQQTAGNYPAIYGAYVDSQRMVRKGDFKLIVYPKAEKFLLFDLKNDPEEINDLADEPAYAEKLQELATELLKLQQHYEDPLDISEMLKVKG
ncbi:sulfatase-like hydrolase/transferase [Marinoscillum furvescens]|uniref:Arylsulfatase A-like enzyme n=1 Tax=Marinoscillum furvescens DSM 4134 TaxID=1122208 RepID=A0A3D9L2R9_MARFU|nr:sulfatase-like hydrolase/transferase [Marinoscillum furvescens]RED95992.1 arylsulfatase A-like enzyme [Marinoscillum furvescens DSM 4134]